MRFGLGYPHSGDLDSRAGHFETVSGNELEKSEIAAPNSARDRHCGFDRELTRASTTQRRSQGAEARRVAARPSDEVPAPTCCAQISQAVKYL